MIDHNIEAIEVLFQLWGGWARESLPGAIKPLMMFKDGSEPSRGDIMSDETAAMFDPAVACLKQIDRELYEVVRLHYIYRLSFNAIAKIKHSNPGTLFRQCKAAQMFVAGFLYGMDKTSYFVKIEKNSF